MNNLNLLIPGKLKIISDQAPGGNTSSSTSLGEGWGHYSAPEVAPKGEVPRGLKQFLYGFLEIPH